jgi:hypothetical protein
MVEKKMQEGAGDNFRKSIQNDDMKTSFETIELKKKVN